MKEDIKPFEKVENFKDLIGFLEDWRSFKDSQIYDYGGMVRLLIACLNNLKRYGLEAELEDISEFFEDEEKEFFLKIAKYLKE